MVVTGGGDVSGGVVGGGCGGVVGSCGGVVGKTGTVQYKELGVLEGSAANWGCFAGPLDSRLERHFGTCPLPLKTQ